MEEKIEQIKTLRDLAKSKREAVKWASCQTKKVRLLQEAADLEKQANELEKEKMNKYKN